MAKVSKFGLDITEFEQFKDKLEAYGESAESKVNEFIHNVASEKFEKSITSFIPLSKRSHNKKYSNDHAKKSKWYEINNKYNLETSISNISGSSWNNGKFYYLYFVDTGTGNAKNSSGVNFSNRGMEKEHNSVINEMLQAFENAEL